ncbi:Tim44 domain-containing protein [Ramlibacter sp. USB13]|uniref:Tim44 domain-containing protein n=1 Tax=Ramlibacter cellulosilyticus TaxID=2764187 RepID=A0A923SA26_9BURK|nr:Tim44-like domain-containing protein [Ramlibacter cellulosilyticus]MBC5782350.1 Tim44 domain-containing protein [Ramlibacter cellulosilyticus]
MKRALALLAVVVTLGMAVTLDAEAKRLGGGKSSGMQRQSVTAPPNSPAGGTATQGVPGQAAPAATSAATAGAAAAAAPKRSWMGPVAGLAAGLGIAALASHFGFGEALANMLTIALVVMAVLMVVGFIMRKRAQGQGPAMAGAGMPRGAQDAGMFRSPLQQQPAPQSGSLIGSRIGGGIAPAATGTGTVPADFDTAAFVRNAKSQFLALQSANDAQDLDRLRDYLTPEMFEAVRSEIGERDAAPQQTEVFGLEAQVLDVAEEADRYIVSVRFTGSVRDQHGAVPEDLDEIWHLTKPRTGFGGWVVAGIQQAS